MVNFLQITEHPQINHECFFEVMRDFRKGGLTPVIYKDFIEIVKNLPSIYERKRSDYDIFNKFNLINVTEEDNSIIMKEVIKRGIERSKICWHPKASNTNCKVDKSGRIIVSAAHSLQNNGVLSKIVENGHVMSYTFDKGDFEGKELGKNHASIFWGFCNTHDAIFSPIEVTEYIKTEEQNFLYAYRGFVVSSHKKLEVSSWMNYGEQSDNDIKENKKIFDDAILANDFSVIETEIFELPLFYPIAASSSFYLDFDFEGNEIAHSEERMEDVFITLFPSGVNKTYFLLSYFKQDSHLYKNLGDQLRKRDNLKSDISMLIAAHVENVYFNPVYYKIFIEKHEDDLMKIMHEAQMDYASLDENDQIKAQISLTPNNYLTNPLKINFFGY
ncbi:hypothetical protein [uncultured Flavobacterium sp.]|uniref:hypothetical protein n=1 Tax=uncultured Flavobacterium sp. TaxID=165435 RepID=UPI00293169C4|nr:hypothetical protein [uncultured Flavobacterium sp.]